jgi:hypothetical protein
LRLLRRKVNGLLFSAKGKLYQAVIRKKLHLGLLRSLAAVSMLEIVEHRWGLKLEDKVKL